MWTGYAGSISCLKGMKWTTGLCCLRDSVSKDRRRNMPMCVNSLTNVYSRWIDNCMASESCNLCTLFSFTGVYPYVTYSLCIMGLWSLNLMHNVQRSACMWLREISSCSCLTFLTGPAWLLLNKICTPFSRSLYRAERLNCILHSKVKYRLVREKGPVLLSTNQAQPYMQAAMSPITMCMYSL